MILIDANLLLYARISSFATHEKARGWLDEQLSGSARVGIPWPSLLAFLRLSTNPRVFEQPLSMTTAWLQVEDWLDCSPVWIPEAGSHHRRIVGSLLANQPISAQLVPDVHLAALAIEHGLTLCSADGDFARFKNLKWVNPVAGGS